MKDGQKLWTRDELILAINLYCKIPFGKIHGRNPEIIALAKLIGRTANSVSHKLVNFASLDPSLKARGIKGATNASKLDKEVWTEFFNHWDVLPYESEKLLAKFQNTTIERLNDLSDFDLTHEGTTREQIIRARVNQSFFRRSILAAYDNTCCITGIRQPELLIASHIIPWAKDEKNRMNPRNGLCLNALHDKAFEVGLISITPKYEIKVSPTLLKLAKGKSEVADYFGKYDGKLMILPKRFLPDSEFLRHHAEHKFQR